MYVLHTVPLFAILGSHSAFKKVYEEPVVQSRQPNATREEKDIGERRAEEVSKGVEVTCTFVYWNICMYCSHFYGDSLSLCDTSNMQCNMLSAELNVVTP